jgi:hypothetical protein
MACRYALANVLAVRSSELCVSMRVCMCGCMYDVFYMRGYRCSCPYTHAHMHACVYVLLLRYISLHAHLRMFA